MQPSFEGWTWPEFEIQVLPSLRDALPICLDRMEYHKNYINELEFRFGFTIDKLEEFWNLMREQTNKPLSE